MFSRNPGQLWGRISVASIFAVSLMTAPAALADDDEKNYDSRFFISAMAGFSYGDTDRRTKGENTSLQLGFGKYIWKYFALEGNAFATEMDIPTAAGTGVNKYDLTGFGLDFLAFPFTQASGFYLLAGGGQQTTRIRQTGTDTKGSDTFYNYGAGFLKNIGENGIQLRGDVRIRRGGDGTDGSTGPQRSYDDLYAQAGFLLPLGSPENNRAVFARAEGERDNRWYIDPMLGVMRADSDRMVRIKSGDPAIQLSAGRPLSDKMNIEFRLFSTTSSTRNAPGREADATNSEVFDSNTSQGIAVDLPFYLSRNPEFSPFFVIGGGFAEDEIKFNNRTDKETVPTMDVGLGFTKSLLDYGLGLRVEARYRSYFEAREDFSDAVFNVGLHIPIGSNPNSPKDDDGDGVRNKEDKCPGTPIGIAVNPDGCPADSDGDGVADDKDECPGTASGVEVNAKGCPPDTDKDGVADADDQCPGTPAGTVVDSVGCPEDSDNDGVADDKDKCPDTPEGSAVDKEGCLVTQIIVLKGVHFEFDAKGLTEDSKAILDDVVAALNGQPNIKAEVAGHTDWKGPTEYNQRLSEERARSVYNHLVAGGIDKARLTIRGYGESRPVADNQTEEGRAKNRRVELQVLSR